MAGSGKGASSTTGSVSGRSDSTCGSWMLYLSTVSPSGCGGATISFD
jgi:hypothetical protein